MTSEDRDLVEELLARAHPSNVHVTDRAAARIQTLSAEIERLRMAVREVFEEWAGSEVFIPETAPEGYLLQLTKRMADIARAALEGDSHDQ